MDQSEKYCFQSVVEKEKFALIRVFALFQILIFNHSEIWGCNGYGNVIIALKRTPDLRFIWQVLEKMVTWRHSLVKNCKVVVNWSYFILLCSWKAFSIRWLYTRFITSFSIFSTKNCYCKSWIWAIGKNCGIFFKYV